jgi:hypothetical protein
MIFNVTPVIKRITGMEGSLLEFAFLPRIERVLRSRILSIRLRRLGLEFGSVMNKVDAVGVGTHYLPPYYDSTFNNNVSDSSNVNRTILDVSSTGSFGIETTA